MKMISYDVDIDLETLEDDIKDYYCNEKRCLGQGFNVCRLKEYISDLYKSLYVFNENKDSKDILSELERLIESEVNNK